MTDTDTDPYETARDQVLAALRDGATLTLDPREAGAPADLLFPSDTLLNRRVVQSVIHRMCLQNLIARCDPAGSRDAVYGLTKRGMDMAGPTPAPMLPPVKARPTTMLTPADLPPADAVIDYGEGRIGPVMLHWLVEGQDAEHIAREAGFDCMWLPMDEDLRHDDPIYVDHFEYGADDTLARWQPTPPAAPGWKLVGKHDTEDGPVALWVRRRVRPVKTIATTGA